MRARASILLAKIRTAPPVLRCAWRDQLEPQVHADRDFAPFVTFGLVEA